MQILLLFAFIINIVQACTYTDTVIDTQLSYAKDAVLMDMDGDSHKDIVAGSSGKITWYKNDGTGSFGSSNTLDTIGPYALSAVDLDQDGDLDLLYVTDSEIGWYQNNNFNFQRNSIKSISIDTGSYFSDIAVGDVDSDGDLDIVTIDEYNIWLLTNDGSSSFAGTSLRWGGNPSSVILADIDHDNDLDVVGTWYDGAGKVSWIEYDHVNNLFGTKTDLFSSPDPYRVRAADIDNDNKIDLVVMNYNPQEISWYKNDGTATFTKNTVDTSYSFSSLAVGDIDNDGNIDIATNTLDKKVMWWKNNGDSTFGSATIFGNGDGRGEKLTLADVNGNGKLDFIVPHRLAYSNSADIIVYSCINICTCSNGVAATATCANDGDETCASCNAGFHLDNGACAANVCTCSNGVLGTCDTHNTESCASCNAGFYLDNSACAANVCTCSNGVLGTCDTHNTEVCASCNAGFYLDNSACAANVCTCSNGVLGTCDTHNTESCASCNAGFYLDNSACAANVCTCSNGIVGTCDTHNTEVCASCNAGFHLDNGCKANVCTCGNGTVGTCSTHNTEVCGSCDAGYYLNNDACDNNVCTCSNGIVGTCDTHNTEVCASCNTGFQLNNKTCVSEPEPEASEFPWLIVGISAGSVIVVVGIILAVVCSNNGYTELREPRF